MIKTKEEILQALKTASNVLKDIQDEEWNK